MDKLVATRCPKCAMAGDFTVREAGKRRPDGTLLPLRDGLARPRSRRRRLWLGKRKVPPPAGARQAAADHRGRDRRCRRAAAPAAAGPA